MTSDPDLSPIVKSVEVPISAKDAFKLFTEKMDTWWPLADKSVSIGRGLPPSESLRVDPHVGGKVVEECVNGDEEVWGEILEWEPGAKFAMTWHPGRSAEMPTQVDVTFTSLGNGCLVELVHSGFDAYAEAAELKAMYSGGWDVLVGTLFAKAAGVALAA